MRKEQRERLLAEAMRATLTPQGWAVAWQQGHLELDAQTVAWLRALPPQLHDLVRRFPPSCLVESRVPLAIPVQGTVGIVTSYNNDGTLSVRQEPDATVRAGCDPDDLEVVGYYRDLMPQRVAALLEEGEGHA